MIFHLFMKDLRKLVIIAVVFILFAVIMCVTLFSEGFIDDNSYLDATKMILAGLLLHMLVFGNLMNVEKYEEKHNAYRMMAPFPVSALEIVAEKFFSILVCTVFGIVSILVIYDLFGVDVAWQGLRIRYLVLTGALTLSLNAIGYLGVFKYGFHRMRPAIMVVYILAMLGPQLTVFLQQVGERAYFLVKIAQMSVPGVIGLAGASLVICCACFFASVRVSESREL